MQVGAVSVEANLIAKRARMKTEKRVSYRDEAAPSTSDSKLERMMENMMERMSIYERPQSRENKIAPQNRNQP